MFESIKKLFKNMSNKEEKKQSKEGSRDAAKERLHLVLMQDRANVSADFLELMKQEIIDVIKKYIEVDEKEIDVRLTNQENEDGTNGAPALYANIPILNIKNEARKVNNNVEKENVENEKEENQTNYQDDQSSYNNKFDSKIDEIEKIIEQDSNKENIKINENNSNIQNIDTIENDKFNNEITDVVIEEPNENNTVEEDIQMNEKVKSEN